MTATFLIVGTSGVAGQSAVDAIRQYDLSSRIIGTTSQESEIDYVDQTITDVALDKPGALETIKKGLSGNIIGNLHIIYTPARGMVGYPIEETTETDLMEGLSFCYDPMVALEKELKPVWTLGYSAFFWLPHTLEFYGCLGYVKKKMEEWAIAQPETRKIIRGGTFFSQSVRGISVLMQRLMKKTTRPGLLQMKEVHLNSGLGFQEFFLHYAYDKEKNMFQSRFPGIPHRPTKKEDLTLALRKILEAEKAPIVSVIGDWNWVDTQLPKLPDFFNKF